MMPAAGKGKHKVHNKKKIKIAIIAAVVAVVAVVAVILVFYNNSYGTNMAKATELYNKERYNEAVIYYEKAEATKEGENDAEAIVKIAECYQKLGDYDKAISYYQRLVDLKRKLSDAISGILTCYRDKGDIVGMNAFINKYNTGDMTYYFQNFAIAEPSADVASGNYDDDISVSLTSTDGATVYYTLDGTTPNAQSYIYTRPISIKNEGDVTLMAIAYGKDGVESPVAVYNYHIEHRYPDAPVISPAVGKYVSGTQIFITVPENADVYYTFDGSDPNRSSALYTGPISLDGEGTITIKAVAINKSNERQSSIVSAEYTIVAGA